MTTIISSVFVYSEPIPNIVIFIAFFFFFCFLYPHQHFHMWTLKLKGIEKFMLKLWCKKKKMSWMNNLIKST